MNISEMIRWIKKNYVLTIYMAISFTGILMFLLIAPIKGASILSWLNMENNSEWTMLDYFRSVLYDQDLNEVYSIHALYPPLAVLSYNYITRITSLDGIYDYSKNMAEVVSTMPYQMMVYMVYMSVGLALLFYAISQLDIAKYKKYVIAVGALLSAPMAAGALERGNCVVYSVAFSLLALVWKDSKNRVKIMQRHMI